MNFKGRDFGKSNTILRIALSRTSGISGTQKLSVTDILGILKENRFCYG